MPLKLGSGTNIAHWLSQSDQRGANRRAWFTQQDMQRIADWGFEHLRLPIDEQQMWDDGGQPEIEAFDMLDQALDWAQQAGLKVVVDLHILRSHFFANPPEPKLFTDPVEPPRFTALWRQLSARLKCRSNDRVAYELLNEAVADDPQSWNRVAMGAFQALRELEPDRTIVLGSNRWNSPLTFDQLQAPDDPKTILTFHYYLPFVLTHHAAPWWHEGGQYDGLIQYPGLPIPEDCLAKLNEPLRGQLAKLNEPYDRARMVVDLAKPLALSRSTGLPLYCGEFGVVDRVPRSPRLAWYRDVVSVFREFGIDWANWEYKAGFGMIDKDGRSTGIAEAMLNL